MRALLLLLLALPVRADDAAAQLQARLDALHALAGRFEQRLLDEAGETELERSVGSFALLRPGHFRWSIEEPDRQLLVAADGHLWHHDVELETATRRTLDADPTRNPLAILIGDGASLLAAYSVAPVAAGAGESAWTLIPRRQSSDFRSVTVVFRDGRPARMELTDPLRRTAVVTFLNLDPDPGLTPGDFAFSPPAGVDIYGDD